MPKNQEFIAFILFFFQTRESVELAMQLQGKRVQNRELRIKRIETKTNTNNVFNKNSTPFKRTKPINKNNQSFQGETMKPKSLKKVYYLLYIFKLY